MFSPHSESSSFFPPLSLPTTGERCCYGNVCFLHKAFSRDSGAQKKRERELSERERERRRRGRLHEWSHPSSSSCIAQRRIPVTFYQTSKLPSGGGNRRHLRCGTGANTFPREGKEERYAVCVVGLIGPCCELKQKEENPLRILCDIQKLEAERRKGESGTRC